MNLRRTAMIDVQAFANHSKIDEHGDSEQQKAMASRPRLGWHDDKIRHNISDWQYMPGQGKKTERRSRITRIQTVVGFQRRIHDRLLGVEKSTASRGD